MKRVKYGKEPVLHVHNYVLQLGRKIGNNWRWKYFYAVNQKEINEFKAKMRKGDVMEIYKAEHNFKEAWTK